MDDARKTAPFIAWLIAYVVIGGVVFLLADEVLRRTAADDMTAVFLSVLAAVVVGWLSASWVQRRVAARVDASEAHRPSA